MSKSIKAYRRAKWLCFACSILFYFLPFIIVTLCMIPTVKTDKGTRCAMAISIIVLNALPFIGGLIRHITAHFPMINFLSILFLLLYSFFTMKIFQNYVYKFCWIELSAAVGSILACVFWNKYKKNSRKVEIAKTNKEMGLT